MSCSSHIPYKKWRLQILSSLFLTENLPQSCRLDGRRFLSSSKRLRNVRAYSTSNDNNHQDSTSSASSEKIENTPLSKKRPSDSLPKSPLFKLAQSHAIGHRPRKPQGTQADDARLRNNPWAVALASPPRYCSATAVRVPKAFLTEMNLVRRIDETTEGKVRKTSMWWMPTALLKDKLPSNTTTPENSSERKPPVMRMLTRALLMEYSPVAKRNTNRKVKAFALAPSEWRMRSSAELSKVEWPERLTDLILRYLGEKVVRSLKEAYRYEQIKSDRADQWRILEVSDLSVPGLIEGLRNIEMKDMQTGAIVIMGDSASETTSDPFDSKFPDYLTLPQTRSTVPVIDLSTLLSASDRQALRESIPRFSEKALFVRADGPKSVDAILALWELKGYVMHDAEYVRDLRAKRGVDEE